MSKYRTKCWQTIIGSITSIVIVASSCLYAQPQQLLNWSVGDGLPQSQVYSLLCDSWGYVWAGTQGGGLGRFDGQSFVEYSEANGLSGNFVVALIEGQDGYIWAGTNNGLSKFNGLKWETVPEVKKAVTSLWSDENGLWVGTPDGLWQLGQDSLIKQSLAGLRISCIKQINEHLVVGTNAGLFQHNGSKWEAITTARGSRPDIWDISQDSLGHTWVASLGQGLFLWENQKLAPIREPGAPSRFTTSVLIGPDRRLWVGTQDQGIFLRNPSDSTWTKLGQRQGLPANYVHSMVMDAWGQIWIGTSGGGLASFRGQEIIAYPPRIGIPGRVVYAITKDSIGQLVISIDNQGLFQQTNDGFEAIIPDSIGLNTKIKSLALDQYGYIWAGTEGQGILRQSRLGWQWIKKGLTSQYVRALAINQDGQIWAGTAGGGINLFEITDSSSQMLQRFSRREGLPATVVNDLHIDSLNRVWIAFRNGGIACWQADSLVHHFNRSAGLEVSNIRSLVEDGHRYLWFGSAGKGIGRLDLYSETPSWDIYGREVGLTSENIYLLAVENESLWVGSEKGVDEVSFDAARQPRQVVHYGAQEGFSGVETCTNAVYVDSLQSAWFGTVDGLMQHQQEEQSNWVKPRPKLWFDDVRLFYRSLRETAYDSIFSSWGQVDKLLELDYRDNHLGFILTSVDLEQPEALQYRWKMNNWDRDWSPWTAQREVSYSNLSPGEYSFQAQVLSQDGQESEILSMAISIQPPIWQEPWFRWALIGLVGLVLALIIGLRIRSIRQQAKQVEERLRLENRALELEQRALQLQMNPHFIFNALNGVQNLIGRADHQTASDYLARFSRLMRGVLNSSRKSNISLSDEIENLQHYLALERFSYGERFDYSFHIDPPDLDTEEWQIPPMILQPLVENAIHHGLAKRQEGGLINLTFKIESEDLLIVSIQDNGQGLEASQAEKPEGHESTALSVARERLHHHLPQMQATKLLQLRTIKSQDSQVLGTEVQVMMPLS